MNFKKIKSDLTATYDDLAKYWGKDIAKPSKSSTVWLHVFAVKN